MSNLNGKQRFPLISSEKLEFLRTEEALVALEQYNTNNPTMLQAETLKKNKAESKMILIPLFLKENTTDYWTQTISIIIYMILVEPAVFHWLVA